MTSVAAPALISPNRAAETLHIASLQSESLRSIHLTGPAGRLEALVNEGAPNAPFAALVCHPHPLGGGTMHNKVVYHAMKALNDPERGLGWPVLRFNFRGTGLSQGQHDGEAESGDVLAALDWLENEYKRPLVVAGFSFGAAMAVKACCSQSQIDTTANVRALAALGLPTRTENREYIYPSLHTCTIPKLFLSGDPNDWCSSPAPITFLRDNWSRCNKHLPVGLRSKCHDTGRRFPFGNSALHCH